MIKLPDPSPANVVIGLSVLVPLLLTLIYILVLWGQYRGHQQQIDYLMPRIERLQGLAEHETELGQARLRAHQRIDELLYRHTDSDALGTELQQQIRRALDDAGMSISGSRILPVEQVDGIDQLRLEINARGNIEALQQALLTLQAMRPLLQIDTLRLQSVQTRLARVEQQLNVRMELLALKVEP